MMRGADKIEIFFLWWIRISHHVAVWLTVFNLRYRLSLLKVNSISPFRTTRGAICAHSNNTAHTNSQTTKKLILNFVANNNNNNGRMKQQECKRGTQGQRKRKQFTLVTCYCIKKFIAKVWVDKPLLICRMFMFWLTLLWIFWCMPAHTFCMCFFLKKNRSRALCVDSINSGRTAHTKFPG